MHIYIYRINWVIIMFPTELGVFEVPHFQTEPMFLCSIQHMGCLSPIGPLIRHRTVSWL